MQTAELFTASQVARELDLSHTTVLRAIDADRIQPDFVAGDVRLFRPERVARLREEFAVRLHEHELSHRPK